MMRNRTYSGMLALETFEDRFEYLKLNGSVGHDTFGSDRHLNQRFYKSSEWLRLRNHIIVRDGGFDLAHPDRTITGPILVHHINPITPTDILHASDLLYDPYNLVCVTKDTHNAIHYGDYNLIKREHEERTPGDTKLW